MLDNFIFGYTSFKAIYYLFLLYIICSTHNMASIKTVIVPWDFTKLSEFALETALRLTTKSGEKIVLVHIVENTGLLDEAARKLVAVSETIFEKFGVQIQVLVRTGNLFKTIHEVADEVNARIMIMGTHGIKGMQKFTGSFAIKIIENARVPFLVIQDQVNGNQHLKLIIPIDLKFDKSGIWFWIEYLSLLYKCTIHFFVRTVDDKALQARLDDYLKFMQTAAIGKNFEYQIVFAEPKGSFTEHIIQFAKKTEADLILISSVGHLNMSDYVLGVPEQNLIANWAKIPVMCVNNAEY